jgi:hypothetical protein
VPDRLVIDGPAGETWHNNTDRVMYQFICKLINTCGVCLQYHMKISYTWPIPLHWNCRCVQRAIPPGGEAPHEFVDYRKMLEEMSPDEQRAAIGASNYKLLKEGVVKWDDIVSESRVRDFREVVSNKRLSVKQLTKAGVRPYEAQRAYAAVTTPAHIAAEAAQKQIMARLKGAGLSQEKVVSELSKQLAGRVSFGPGPTGPYTQGPAWPSGGLPSMGPSSAAEIRALLTGWAVGRYIMPPHAPPPQIPTPQTATPHPDDLKKAIEQAIEQETPYVMPPVAPPPPIQIREGFAPLPGELAGAMREALPEPKGLAPVARVKALRESLERRIAAGDPTAAAELAEIDARTAARKALLADRAARKAAKAAAAAPPVAPPAPAAAPIAPPPAIVTTPPTPFPTSVDRLEVVRTMPGSSRPELVRDEHGRQFIRKEGVSAEHLRSEAAAENLYRAMGVDVPASQLYERPGMPPVKLSAFEAGKTLGSLEYSDPAAYKAAVDKVKANFVKDALLGNWDVIGASADNILVTPDNRVLRIDAGGALAYRARGEPKRSGWGPVVGELDSMRDASRNPAAAKVFKSLTHDEIKGQIADVVARRDAILAAAPTHERYNLSKRIDSLEAYVARKAPAPPAPPIAPTPAATPRPAPAPTAPTPSRPTPAAPPPGRAAPPPTPIRAEHPPTEGPTGVATTSQYRDKFRNVASRYDRELQTEARHQGTTAEQLRANIKGDLQQILDGAQFYKRVHADVLELVLQSGRFKTQFETGSSDGCLSPGFRKTQEALNMGIPETTADRNRPNYGYVSAPDFASRHEAAERSVRQYGAVAIRFKDSVRDRTTVTFGDSLAHSGVASHTSDVKIESLSNLSVGVAVAKSTDPIEVKRAKLQARVSYIELQYHDTLDVDDIRDVAFIEQPKASTIRMLAAKGIPWRVLPP